MYNNIFFIYLHFLLETTTPPTFRRRHFRPSRFYNVDNSLHRLVLSGAIYTNKVFVPLCGTFIFQVSLQPYQYVNVWSVVDGVG